MSITFGNGIRLGAGVAVTPFHVSPGDIRFDPAYIGSMLGTELNDTSLFDGDAGSYVGLTTVKMVASGKYMTSWTLTYNQDGGQGIGIANRSVDLNNFLGHDSNGVGLFQDGSMWYNNNPINGGFETWGVGDTVDMAIDNQAALVWIRVNGGNWNNDPAGDPATGVSGMSLPITGEYIAACIQGYTGGSEWAMCLQSQYAVPAGYSFFGPGPAFTVNVGDFATGTPIYQNTNPIGTNGTEGFENTAPETWLGEGYYMYNFTPESFARINAALTQAGIDTNSNTGHVFLATWGSGSTISYGLVKIGFYNGGSGGTPSNAYLDIQTIDRANTDWQQPNNNNGTSLVGTFKFPASFTVYTPLLAKSNWC